MRQKLGIILALAHSPRLLILDEPTSGLDPLIRQVLHERLRALVAAGHTVFFSSHSLGEVEQLCDRIAIVRGGELVANESMASLRERAGHDVTIRWKDASAGLTFSPPDYLRLSRREGAIWGGRLEGSVQQLVEFLAGKTIEDLQIGRPDLESLFRRYYEREQEGG
jgi:ABC-2 type transport system ATP-binding protein